MSGAVLPCGSILSVQRADFDWKKKKQESQQQPKFTDSSTAKDNSYYGQSRGIQNVATVDSLKTKDEKPVAAANGESPGMNESNEDDLDDFFASLE